MKKLAFILMTVLSFGVFTAQAAGKTKSESKSELKLDTSTEYETVKIATNVPLGLKNAVTEKLNKHAKERQLKGEAYMRLCVDKNNNVKVVGMNATTPSIKRYVTRELSSTNVTNPGCKPGKVYMIKVTFNTLN